MNRDALAFGWFGPYDDNEVECVSTIRDPVKYRGGVLASALQSDDYNLVAFTGNIVRDTDGRHEEYGGYRVGLAPDRRGGALRLFVRDSNGNEKEVAYFDERNAVVLGRQFGEIPASSVRISRFYTDGGKFLINWQDDQDSVRAVIYRVVPGEPESQWPAVGVKTFWP